MGPHYWRNRWHLWGMLRISEGWHFTIHWCVILMIFILLGAIPPNYSGNVRTLFFVLPLRYWSYRIAYRHWHTPFCDARQTRGLLWWNCLGRRHRFRGHIRGWPHGQTIHLCGPLTSVHPCGSSPSSPVHDIVSTYYTRLPFVCIFHVFLVISYSSVRPTYDTWIRWIW